MSSISHQHDPGDDYVAEQIDTGTQTVELNGHLPYRHLWVSLDDGQVVNDGVATETVTVDLRDRLEIARGAAPATATVLAENNDVTVSVDGVETTKTLTDGSVSFEVVTEKPAGSEIEIVAESLANHPAESDSATIEVKQ